MHRHKPACVRAPYANAIAAARAVRRAARAARKGGKPAAHVAANEGDAWAALDAMAVAGAQAEAAAATLARRAPA